MTEIERARESIEEYRIGYGQSQLPTDCIIQLMMGHSKSEQLILSGAANCLSCGKNHAEICGSCVSDIAQGTAEQAISST